LPCTCGIQRRAHRRRGRLHVELSCSACRERLLGGSRSATCRASAAAGPSATALAPKGLSSGEEAFILFDSYSSNGPNSKQRKLLFYLIATAAMARTLNRSADILSGFEQIQARFRRVPQGCFAVVARAWRMFWRLGVATSKSSGRQTRQGPSYFPLAALALRAGCCYSSWLGQCDGVHPGTQGGVPLAIQRAAAERLTQPVQCPG
jgi:hypothetical protein